MTANRIRLAVFLIIIAFSAQLACAALATSQMNKDGLSLDVTAVERKGNVLTVKWAVKNSGSDSTSFIFNLSGDHTTTYAVDEENGKKYYVLHDSEKHALASADEYTGSGSGITDRVAAGQTKRYWMKLPAPPAAVKKINIFFTDAEPVEDVAITDKQ